MQMKPVDQIQNFFLEFTHVVPNVSCSNFEFINLNIY